MTNSKQQNILFFRNKMDSIQKGSSEDEIGMMSSYIFQKEVRNSRNNKNAWKQTIAHISNLLK